MAVKKTDITKRTHWILAIFFIFIGLMVLRLAYWQIIRGNEMSAKVERQQAGNKEITLPRGNIYDRNGELLAESASVSTLVCNPKDVESRGNADVIAEKLSFVLDLKYEDVYKALTADSRYQVIKKRLSADETAQVKALIQADKSSDDDKDKDKDSDDSTKKSNPFAGIYFENDSKRYYKYSTAAHLLGFTGYDGSGRTGIELTFDDSLAGKFQNADGTVALGADVVTTIDENIQQFLETALEGANSEYKLKEGACGIVMNPKTGEILAMATKPDFDTNNPFSTERFESRVVDFEFYSDVLGRTVTKEDNLYAKRITTKAQAKQKESDDKVDDEADKDSEEKQIQDLTDKEREKLFEERTVAMQNKMWRNKAITDAYEPGSTFKIITAAAALEEGKVKKDDTFKCTGSLHVDKYDIKCANEDGHGDETFVEGVQNSCNPVFMQIAMDLGSEKFMEYFSAFGLTEKTGIDLVGESDSIYYKDKTLGLSDLATSSFGQGFNVTPIQLITAVSAAINGGYRMKPQIVKQIKNDKGVIKNYKPEVVNKVISEQTSKTLREILETVVSSPTGTGKNAYIAGYRIGGKTGTSEKGDRTSDRRIASFVGFAPADDPEIVCLIMLDEPQTDNRFGGSIAAPLAGRVIEQVLEYMGVERRYGDNEEAAEITIQTPDVREKSISSAVSALDKLDLDYIVKGDGETIVGQCPSPGVSLDKNSFVVLFTDDDWEESTVSVPDLSGLSENDARDVLYEYGLNFTIAGAGHAVVGSSAYRQTVAAGKEVMPGTVVGVEFRQQASD